MKRISLLLLGLLVVSLCVVPQLERSSVSANSAAFFPPGTFFAVDTTNTLRSYNLASPGVQLSSVAISGLQPGEQILGIDFRPATGQLYGLGSTSRIYVVNTVTGVAAPVGTMPFTPALNGTDFGFDFNPTVDRIRVVSDAEQNLRLHPDTGAVAGVDGALTPAGNVVASAYINNFAGATTTVLYAIDSGSDTLQIQNPPNDGVLSTVGPLGVDTTGLTGFDVAPGGTAYASLTAPAATTSSLYTINLSTGAATLVGTIAGMNAIRDIAVVAGNDTIFGLTSGNNLVRFDSNTPGTIVSTSPITGLQMGETLLGIDFRPATGQLYALGSTSRLYVVNPANGMATAVGTMPFTPALSGTDFGFDFNPTVDRIRVVSDAEQNLRLHPDTGAVVFTDTNLTPPGNVVAAAYINNFAGATTTTLYDIDSVSDLLLTQNPPNNGVLNAVGPLGVNTSGLTGFDVSGNGMAYASLTAPAASTSSLYRVNLTTGAATLVGAIGGGETIRDIAVRVCTDVVYGIAEQAGPTYNLIRFNPATPGIIISSVAITGLQAGEALHGIDFRPATGQLYALGSTSRLYTINLMTGAATAIGAGPFTPALNGTRFGFDFNPTVDRIRVVSDAEQNLRLHPVTGAVAFTDTNLTPAGNVVGAAYVNNFAGATTTTLYDVDSASNTLLTQSPPNDGVLNTVGPLGIDITDIAGFDVGSGTGNAYLAAYTGGPSPALYMVNLQTGAATLIGTIGVTGTLVGIAVQVTGTAGVDTPGVYSPSTNTVFLRNSNSAGPADVTFIFGMGVGLVEIKGDWDGDGDDTAGIYNPTAGTFFLRNSNSSGPADITFQFGLGGLGYVPISGDWDGDGDDTVGLYDPATGTFFLKNTNSSGAADVTFIFGVGGAIPIAGDWNNDNTDSVGLYIASSATFFLRNSNTNGPADLTFIYGAPSSTPIAGDWDGDGTDTIGTFQSGTASWFLRNSNTSGNADVTFIYGAPGQAAIAGDWDGN